MFGLKKKEKEELKTAIDNQATTGNETEEATEDTNEKLTEGFKKLLSLFVGVDRSITDITPYKEIREDGFLAHKDGHYQAYLKVKTYDLQSMNDNDLNRLTQSFQNLLRIYTEPFKIISMTYPTETRDQQNFQRAKINQYNKRLQNDRLTSRQRDVLDNKRLRAMEELRRVEWAEDTLKDLTFFFVVYGETIEDVKESVRSMQRLGQRYFGLNHITDKQILENIVSQLNNMNREI